MHGDLSTYSEPKGRVNSIVAMPLFDALAQTTRGPDLEKENTAEDMTVATHR